MPTTSQTTIQTLINRLFHHWDFLEARVKEEITQLTKINAHAEKRGLKLLNSCWSCFLYSEEFWSSNYRRQTFTLVHSRRFLCKNELATNWVNLARPPSAFCVTCTNVDWPWASYYIFKSGTCNVLCLIACDFSAVTWRYLIIEKK